MDPSTITVRPLRTREEYNACVALQRDTWGHDFVDCVPATILMVSQRVGGVTAGAFDPAGTLLGFVFGVSGVSEGRLVHWSDMLAIRPDAQGLGLGKRLKAYQRELLLENRIEVAYWSYDPLVARNANLNINALAARPIEYVPNMYGDTRSKLHSLGTDRFVVEWNLTDPKVEQALGGGSTHEPTRWSDTPVVSADSASTADPTERDLPGDPRVRVEIPDDIQRIVAESLEVATRWRLTTKRAFLWYLERGYRVEGFYRLPETSRYFYLVHDPRATS